jgi:hypothetical protein
MQIDRTPFLVRQVAPIAPRTRAHRLSELIRPILPVHRTRRFRLDHRGVGSIWASTGRPAVPHLIPMQFPFSDAKGAKGGLIYESVRNTSAAAADPTQQTEYLVGVILEGGATAGAWEYLWDGVHTAIFPVGASGLDATGAIGPQACAFYPLNYGPVGTGLTAAAQTYGGGIAAVTFVFSNKTNPTGLSISDFTGVFVTGNESGTGGTSRTYTIPGALGKPTGITALAAIEAGTATGIPVGVIEFPAIGNYAQYVVPAVLARGHEVLAYHQWPVPDYDPASSFALTHLARGLGGATDLQIAGALWYEQALQPTARA